MGGIVVGGQWIPGGIVGWAPASLASGLHTRLHGFVKTALLQQLVPPSSLVCDLFCGRGLDTERWADAGIGQYIGVDLSASALEEAQEQWEQHGKQFPAKFCELDPCMVDLEPQLKEHGLPADVVSCLGHLQDCCTSEDILRCFLKNVVAVLKSGGFFFGLTPDSSTIWYKYQKAVEGAMKAGALRLNGALPCVRTELYKISFEDDRFNSYGSKYHLRFADDGLPTQAQLLVHFPSLIRVAEEVGLECVEIQNCLEFYEDYGVAFAESLRNSIGSTMDSKGVSMLDAKGRLAVLAQDVLSLYTTFVFKKVDASTSIIIHSNIAVEDGGITTRANEEYSRSHFQISDPLWPVAKEETESFQKLKTNVRGSNFPLSKNSTNTREKHDQVPGESTRPGTLIPTQPQHTPRNIVYTKRWPKLEQGVDHAQGVDTDHRNDKQGHGSALNATNSGQAQGILANPKIKRTSLSRSLGCPSMMHVDGDMDVERVNKLSLTDAEPRSFQIREMPNKGGRPASTEDGSASKVHRSSKGFVQPDATSDKDGRTMTEWKDRHPTEFTQQSQVPGPVYGLQSQGKPPLDQLERSAYLHSQEMDRPNDNQDIGLRGYQARGKRSSTMERPEGLPGDSSLVRQEVPHPNESFDAVQASVKSESKSRLPIEHLEGLSTDSTVSEEEIAKICKSRERDADRNEGRWQKDDRREELPTSSVLPEKDEEGSKNVDEGKRESQTLGKRRQSVQHEGLFSDSLILLKKACPLNESHDEGEIGAEAQASTSSLGKHFEGLYTDSSSAVQVLHQPYNSIDDGKVNPVSMEQRLPEHELKEPAADSPHPIRLSNGSMVATPSLFASQHMRRPTVEFSTDSTLQEAIPPLQMLDESLRTAQMEENMSPISEGSEGLSGEPNPPVQDLFQSPPRVDTSMTKPKTKWSDDGPSVDLTLQMHGVQEYEEKMHVSGDSSPSLETRTNEISRLNHIGENQAHNQDNLTPTALKQHGIPHRPIASRHLLLELNEPPASGNDSEDNQP